MFLSEHDLRYCSELYARVLAAIKAARERKNKDD